MSKSILEVQKYIWSIHSSISAGQNTHKSLQNLWSNGLVNRVQVYQTKDPRFKTIRWLKNWLSFHPSKVNLRISRILGDLVVKSKSSQWLCCLQKNKLYLYRGPLRQMNPKKGLWFFCTVYFWSTVTVKYTYSIYTSRKYTLSIL